MLLVASLLVVSLAAAPALAAMSVDNNTTYTSTTSDLTDGATVSDLDNASKAKTIQVNATNASGVTNAEENFKLELTVNDTGSAQDGETILTTDETWTAVAGTDSTFNLSKTHPEYFDSVERDAGQNVTLDVTATYNESETDEESVTIQIDAQNDAQPRVVADDRASLQATGLSVPGLDSNLFGTDADAAKSERTVGVNENTTEIVVQTDNANVSDSLDAATADTADGELTPDAYVRSNGHLVPVFDSSADAEWVGNDTAYAIADTTSGEVVIHNADETFDGSSTSSIDVVTGLNANAGFFETYRMVLDSGADRTEAISAGIGAGVGQTFDDA